MATTVHGSSSPSWILNTGMTSRVCEGQSAIVSTRIHVSSKWNFKNAISFSVVKELKNLASTKTLLECEDPQIYQMKGSVHLALLRRNPWTKMAAVHNLKLLFIEDTMANNTMKPQGYTPFPSAWIIINAVMFALPFEALAETCGPGNTYSMPLLFAIAMIGATVGGLLARQRKGELQRVNDQLRQINATLRRQAKRESYAPTLSYAPVGKIPENEIIIGSNKQQLIKNLKTGKNFLRNQQPENAFTEFKAALDLAQGLGDPIEEKKAARGLGACLQRQGKYQEAIKHHSMVLAISDREGEDSGNTEAYGAIADCYTELGDLEQAGKFYDKYISMMED